MITLNTPSISRHLSTRTLSRIVVVVASLLAIAASPVMAKETQPGYKLEAKVSIPALPFINQRGQRNQRNQRGQSN